MDAVRVASSSESFWTPAACEAAGRRVMVCVLALSLQVLGMLGSQLAAVQQELSAIRATQLQQTAAIKRLKAGCERDADELHQQMCNLEDLCSESTEERQGDADLENLADRVALLESAMNRAVKQRRM